ncbi:MAG: TerB family tellurite resistance protein [Roseovarius sp.]|nr:TerB family tellurite resistance protein [Roseovarius sp.]
MEVKTLLQRLLHARRAPRPQPLPEPDEKLALGALMVRVAMSDRDYQLAEISRIDRLLGRLYGLGPIEAARMRATCEKLARAVPESDRFAHLIRETVSFEARTGALAALWEVVLADGSADPAELHVIEEVREALGLSEEDSAHARAAAERS